MGQVKFFAYANLILCVVALVFVCQGHSWAPFFVGGILGNSINLCMATYKVKIKYEA